MEKHEAILAELEQLRESAVAQMRAKLTAVAGQIREAASQLQESAGRATGDLDAVVPTDPEQLFPMGGLSERLQELAAPVAAPAVGLDVMRRLDAGRAQSEVLQDLLHQIGPWSGPRAIVVLREGIVQGWASAGFPQGDPARGWRGTVADSPAISRAAEGKPVVTRSNADPVLGSWFGGGGQKVLLVPMSLRSKVVGLLLAVEGEAGLDTTVVQQLTYTVGLMLETLSGRTIVPTAALLDPEDMTAAAAQAPVSQPAPPAELFELETEPVAPVRPSEPPPVVAPRPVPHEVAEPIADASATVHFKVPLAPGPPPPPPPPVPAPAPAVPPPGAARSPEEERKHEEAKRFARLLVSEIRLYNEQAVQAGKIARDIYHRLKDDIDRSREMYEQRVSADVRATSNYFRDEMVRILADGEPDALGM
jgi:hypothetical protein